MALGPDSLSLDGLIIEDNRVYDIQRRNEPRPRAKQKGMRTKRVLAAFSATVALAAAFTAAAVVKESVSSKSDAAVATAATANVTVPDGWRLTFNQGFSGKKLNTKVWSTCYWWARPGQGCTNTGNSNEEKEWYQPSQDQVSGGELHLVAKPESTEGTNGNGKPEKYYCRSGMVTTNTSFNFEYGFVQFVVRVPYGSGLWPALWLSASNHKWPPEIDLLEHWASQTNAGVYLHPTKGARQGGRVNLPSNFSEGWHSVSLYWTKTRITWYFDGHQVFTATKDLPQQKMFLVMNVADTSTAPGTCNGTMLVKSVQVWQPKP
jgi:beta-glucanase (GH16 family)